MARETGCRLRLPVCASLLISLTIGVTKTNAHPAVVAIGAAHLIATHVVATHMIAGHMIAGHMVAGHMVAAHMAAGHAAAAVGAHAAVAHGVAAHSTVSHLAAINGADEAGLGASEGNMAARAVFAHGIVMHGIVEADIPAHLASHGSMLTYAHCSSYVHGSPYVNASSPHTWGTGTSTSMHAWGTGNTTGGTTPLAGHVSVSSGSSSQQLSMLSDPPGGTFESPSTAQQFAQQGYGVYSIHSPGYSQNYIGSAYYTRFRTYPPKTLTGYSPTYGSYSPYPGASTCGTYNSGDLFSGTGGYTGLGFSPSVGMSSSSASTGIFSSAGAPLNVPLNYGGYTGYGPVSPLAAGFGGFRVPPSAAISYSKYLANPGYGVYTGQAGSSVYPALGASAYSPAVPNNLISSYPVLSTASYSAGMPSSYTSYAAQIRLFPTATNNYGFGDTVFSTNTAVAASQPNAFSGAFAAALPNTASGNLINSSTALGLYNSL